MGETVEWSTCQHHPTAADYAKIPGMVMTDKHRKAVSRALARMASLKPVEDQIVADLKLWIVDWVAGIDRPIWLSIAACRPGLGWLVLRGYVA